MFTKLSKKMIHLRSFIVSTLLMTAVAATAQEKMNPATNSESKTDDAKLKTELSVGFDNVAALTLTEKKVEYYNDLIPFFSASVEGKNGLSVNLSGTQLLVLGNEGKINPVTAKFLLEVCQKIGSDGALVFRAGREPTEGGHIMGNALKYYADGCDFSYFGNAGSERIAFGYQKGDNYIELGIMGSAGEGFYVIPNPKAAEFWTKGKLTLLKESGIKLWMDGAFRGGHGKQKAFGSVNLDSDNGFGVAAFGNYDFSQNDANLAIRAYKKIKKDFKAVFETMLRDNHDVFVRAGGDYKGFQISLEYSNPKDGPQGVSMTTAYCLTQSKKIK